MDLSEPDLLIDGALQILASVQGYRVKFELIADESNGPMMDP